LVDEDERLLRKRGCFFPGENPCVENGDTFSSSLDTQKVTFPSAGGSVKQELR
jgi:hypothetical protein